MSRVRSSEAPSSSRGLPPAVEAFNAIAEEYDQRFSGWESVAAQRRAVRRELLGTFEAGTQLIELGGGTGDDALFLAEHDRSVLVTDGAPAMVARTLEKARRQRLAGRVDAERMSIEDLERFAADRVARRQPLFDGAYSNFASLNCVADLGAVGRGLATMIRPGGSALLVVFGPMSPGEVVVELLRGRPSAAFRRLGGGDRPARLSGRHFSVRYPSPRAYARAFSPYFGLARTRGIGVFVPPSAAEPVISRFPRTLSVLETLDRIVSAPLAWFGDHVLLHFVRTAVPVTP